MEAAKAAAEVETGAAMAVVEVETNAVMVAEEAAAVAEGLAAMQGITRATVEMVDAGQPSSSTAPGWSFPSSVPEDVPMSEPEVDKWDIGSESEGPADDSNVESDDEGHGEILTGFTYDVAD